MKEAILQWLNSPDKNYHAGLALLMPLTSNKYLLRHLSLKENTYNRAKLEHELKRVANSFPEEIKLPTPVISKPAPVPKVPVVPTVPEEAEIDLNSMTPEQTAAAVEKLEVALGKMHNKKGILSNSLRKFNVKDNEGRKAILSQIDGLTEDMNQIRQKLAYHQKHGKLPPILADKTKKAKPIPDDPVKMKEMLLNLRTSRTKINKQLKIATAAEKEKLETRLHEKLGLINEIERRLHAV